jgi:hypothetical protein
MLWHGDDYNRSPPIMTRWIETAPASFRHQAIPPRLAQDGERILSAEGATAELGLQPDLANLDMAPFLRAPAMHSSSEYQCDDWKRF